MHIADELEGDVIRLDEAQGPAESASYVVLLRSHELYEGSVLGGSDALYLLDEEFAHAPTASAPGDDEHGNVNHCVAVGKIRLDLNARHPHQRVTHGGFKLRGEVDYGIEPSLHLSNTAR